MAAELLNRESVKTIEGWVERHKGYIVRTGGTNVKIVGPDFYTSVVLKSWLDILKAEVYFDRGFINISNWPKDEKVFEVRTRGDIDADGLHHYLMKDTFWSNNVISVEERGEKEEGK